MLVFSKKGFLYLEIEYLCNSELFKCCPQMSGSKP